MIKVQVFDGTENPIEVIAKGDLEDFIEWTNQGKIVGVAEKDTDALLTIPILKYPVKVTQLEREEREEEEETCHCENCKNKKQ